MKERIKILDKKPKIAEHEIDSMMNFDQLLSQSMTGAGVGAHEALSSGVKMGMSVTVKTIITTVVVVSVSSVVWLFTSPKATESPLNPVKQEVPAVNMMASADSVSTEDEMELITEDRAQKEIIETNDQPAITVQKQSNSAASTISAVDETVNSNRRNKEGYRPAVPVLGYDSLYDYFSRELVLPPGAATDASGLNVEVVFDIDAEGGVSNVSIQQVNDSALVNSIRKMILQMPSWRSATMNGKPIKSSLSLPLNLQSSPTN